ncbi:MAG: hypothetical protein K0R16_300 [Nitrososphaeraceae archaeon]|jgi:hypothetical protein|nr:hypothetical protein [Nitrososphaeraceae archaeon]MDF2769884.1 hypothetical protein [Nitrososphaeraceae archaeon]
MAQGEYISPKRQTIVDMNYTMTVVYSGPNYHDKFVSLFTGCNSSDNSVAKPSRPLNPFHINN